MALRIRKLFVPTFLIVISLLIGLLAVELIVRMMFDYEEVFLVADPALGFAHPAGRTGLYMREREKPHTVTINSKGLRDQEHEYRKPSGVRRIAMIGDSMTEGMQVGLAKTATKQLERLLHDSGHDNFEVMNFGVSGYGTTQQLLYYTREVVKYDPDVVVLNLFLGNDLAENLYREGNFQRPAYTLTDGELVFHPSKTEGSAKLFIRDNILTRSALLKILKPALLSNNPELHKFLGRLGLVAGLQDIGPPDPALLTELAIKIIQQFHVESQKYGHTLLVNLLPSSVDMYPSYPSTLPQYDHFVKSRWDIDTDKAIARHSYFHMNIVAYLSQSSIPYSDAYTKLRNSAARNEILYTSMQMPNLKHGHFSALGHRRSAESIFDALVGNDLL